MMRVIIAGGGTGGHIFPALSIAEEITDRSADNKVLFIGTLKGMERDLIQSNGFNIEYIRSGGLVGKGLFSKLNGLFSASAGLYDSFSVLRMFRPDVVIGVGGYVSGPVVLAARIMSVPTAICEQNSIPGFTNRILSRIADRIFVTFDESMNSFDENKTLITGNPLRKKILRDYRTESAPGERFRILITGGSQGASKINRIIPEALNLGNKEKVTVTHQSGKRDFDCVKDAYKKNGIEAEVYQFIDDMSEAYSRADLVISRAGAGTVSELSILGKPSILVPYPHAANNHQYYNARYMEKGGAAVVVEEKDLNHMIFYKIIDKILNREKLDEMSANALKLARPGAAGIIVDEITKLAERK